MVASTTGKRRLRAGLPDTWRVGDKTGAGANGAFNDVAIAWPTVGAPLILAVYLSGSGAPTDTLDAVHAVAARLVSRELVPSAAFVTSSRG
jgi:beta-lactamase class A